MAFAELKRKQSEIWGNGPYERITATIRDLQETVVDRLEPAPGVEWLDVACGTGATAFLAAERGATVTGQDLAPALVATARTLAAGRGLDVRFDVGDAEDLPYEDGSFDAVSSTCGVMFAPDHVAVAQELARVTRRGGRVGLACWTPDGHAAEMFRMMAPFAPPPVPGAGSPFDWGSDEHVRALLGDAFELSFERLVSPLRVRSGEAHWELFSTSFGPTKTLVESLGVDRRDELYRAWIEFSEQGRREGDELVHDREYLLTVGARR
jgi:SAM-dependent methyltransferase